MSDSSFSDQIAGLTPTENGEAESESAEPTEETETAGPDPELLPEPAPVGPETPPEVATAANTGYVAPEDATLTPTAVAVEEPGVQTVEQEFVLKSHMDPMRQKDQFGHYADDSIRRQNEIEQAEREGREPDFDNMGFTVGDVLVPKSVAEQMSFAEPPRGVPVAFTADVVVGSPEIHDSQGNVPEEEQSDE